MRTYKLIFETHAHYDDEAFDEDRDVLLNALHTGKEDGSEVAVARIVNCGASMKGCRESLELAGKYDFIYAAVGIHPDDCGILLDARDYDKYDFSEEQAEEYRRLSAELAGENGTELLRCMAADEKTVAIGEIGLDYHWDRWPRKLQRDMFIRQWEMAAEFGLPIEIHSRDAAEDTMNIVRDMYEREKAAGRELHADMHCYSYSSDQAREYAKMGLYFGVGGVVTFKNARKVHEVVAELPLERILLETDCPYLAPEPHRGQRNNSGYIVQVAAKIAEIKGITTEEVLAVTFENACRFFERRLKYGLSG